MSRQDELIAELNAAAQQVDNAVSGLTDEQASRPTLDGWSVKDHLTHLTVWHEMRFFEISRVGKGGSGITPNFADVDAFNEAFAKTRRELSLPQVIADLTFAREMVHRAVVDCPEDRLDSKHYLEASPAGGIAHEAEHAETISGWRAKERL